MFDALHAAKSGRIVEQVEEAVQMATSLGCQVAGLGGYNSIVTSDCQRITHSEIGLTSGNALTVGMCLRAVEEVAQTESIQVRAAAVVGASGNIGRAYARCLASQVAELTLVVRRPGSRRSRRFFEELTAAYPETQIQLTDGLEGLRHCQLIIGASNSPEPVVGARNIGQDPCIICDVALPSDIASDVAELRPQARIIRGGIVRLPDNPDLTLSGLNLPAGRVFACIAETLLMGLAGERGHGSRGELTVDQIQRMLSLADEHGFRHEIHFRESSELQKQLF